jgi:hypothetical protein
VHGRTTIISPPTSPILFSLSCFFMDEVINTIIANFCNSSEAGQSIVPLPTSRIVIYTLDSIHTFGSPDLVFYSQFRYLCGESPKLLCMMEVSGFQALSEHGILCVENLHCGFRAIHEFPILNVHGNALRVQHYVMLLINISKLRSRNSQTVSKSMCHQL